MNFWARKYMELNIHLGKRLLANQEQISQVNYFLVFLCMGSCKNLE